MAFLSEGYRVPHLCLSLGSALLSSPSKLFASDTSFLRLARESHLVWNFMQFAQACQDPCSLSLHRTTVSILIYLLLTDPLFHAQPQSPDRETLIGSASDGEVVMRHIGPCPLGAVGRACLVFWCRQGGKPQASPQGGVQREWDGSLNCPYLANLTRLVAPGGCVTWKGAPEPW